MFTPNRQAVLVAWVLVSCTSTTVIEEDAGAAKHKELATPEAYIHDLVPLPDLTPRFKTVDSIPDSKPDDVHEAVMPDIQVEAETAEEEDIYVPVYGPEVLFSEHFDSNPFAGRWKVFKADCQTPKDGTVEYAKDHDGCDGGGGYVWRKNGGGRCLEYVGPPFTTKGYTDLTVNFAYRLDGGSIGLSLLKNGSWTGVMAEAEGSGMASWAAEQTNVSGEITGIRLFLDGDSDVTRRLDCVEIIGEVACQPAVEFYSHPQSQHVCPGGGVTLTAKATGDQVTYQWRKDGVALVDGPGVSGAATNKLALSDLQPSDAGKYRCKASGVCGDSLSAPASVTVGNGPSVIQGPPSLQVCEHADVVLPVVAQGAGEVSYQWEKDGAPLQAGAKYAGVKTGALTIHDFTGAEAGDYRCEVTDQCGATLSEAGAVTLRAWDAKVNLPSAGDLDKQVPVSLPYNNDWVLEADLNGCNAGHFKRYLKGKETTELDLFVHGGDDKLGLRLANQKIWFMSANIGEGHFYPEWLSDHYAYSLHDLPVSGGNHTVRIEYRPYPGSDEGNCKLFWDGALVGDWEFWGEGLPAPMTYLRVGHISGGKLRYLVGCQQP